MRRGRRRMECHLVVRPERPEPRPSLVTMDGPDLEFLGQVELCWIRLGAPPPGPRLALQADIWSDDDRLSAVPTQEPSVPSTVPGTVPGTPFLGRWRPKKRGESGLSTREDLASSLVNYLMWIPEVAREITKR
jgi:hypothetical protein